MEGLWIAFLQSKVFSWKSKASDHAQLQREFEFECGDILFTLTSALKLNPAVDEALSCSKITPMPPEKINLGEKFSLFSDHWNPRVAGRLNGQAVKLVKFQGEFVWHKHDQEDELFLVVKGYFDMELRDKIVRLNEGEMIIIPRGVEHRPVAEREVEVLLFEPETTLNTGDAHKNELTRENLKEI